MKLEDQFFFIMLWWWWKCATIQHKQGYNYWKDSNKRLSSKKHSDIRWWNAMNFYTFLSFLTQEWAFFSYFNQNTFENTCSWISPGIILSEYLNKDILLFWILTSVSIYITPKLGFDTHIISLNFSASIYRTVLDEETKYIWKLTFSDLVWNNFCSIFISSLYIFRLFYLQWKTNNESTQVPLFNSHVYWD